MFVRFRNKQGRLQVSLVVARRDNGKVRNEHVASLGSVPAPPSVDDRLAFWKGLHERLAKLANRVDPATQGKVLGAIHARIPMVLIDEQRDVQLRNAEADERFWTSLRDMNAASVEDHEALAATVARAIADMQSAADDAAAKSAAAKERAERIKRGEDVQGGLGKPQTREDIEKELIARYGWTRADFVHSAFVGSLPTDVFDAAVKEFTRQSESRRRSAFKAAVRAVLKLRSTG
jgi:hypothetical protein